jgi:hypothetical protein
MKLPTLTMYRNLAKLLKMWVKFWLLKISKKNTFFHFYLEFSILDIYIYSQKQNCCGESLEPNHKNGQPAKIN